MSLTLGTVSSSKGPPKSVAEITQNASQYDFDALIPLKYWLRSAAAMLRQVSCTIQHYNKLKPHRLMSI